MMQLREFSSRCPKPEKSRLAGTRMTVLNGAGFRFVYLKRAIRDAFVTLLVPSFG